MTITPFQLTTFNHTRSLSLPSQSNSAFSRFEENLSNVRGSMSEDSCSSLSSMNKRLNNLQKLFCSKDDLLQLPHVQHIISQQGQEKWFDRVLDGHINLLDACTSAKDHVSQTKQNIQELLSGLRRKDVNSIQSALNSRMKSKKAIQKYLRDIVSCRKRKESIITSLEKDNNETAILIHMLEDAKLVTITMLESLLAYLSGTNKVRGWRSLVSKLMASSKRSMSYCNQNEFEKIDCLLFQMTSLEDALRVDEGMSLKEMDSDINGLEEELDCLFKQLIKTRVFLLNLLN